MRKRDVKWGFLSQVLGVSAGLLLLPVVLHYLSSEDVGLWYVFISLAGLSQLLEIGFKPTISRYVAYVYAGAEKLYADGYEGKFKKGEVNLELLKQLFIASKKIYLRVSIASLLLLVVGGSFYISSILSESMSLRHVLIAWLLYCFGVVINFYYGYFNAFLEGRGDITQENKIIVISRIIMISLGCILVPTELGLIGLGVASLVSSLVGRYMASRFFWREKETQLLEFKSVNHEDSKLMMAIVWPNAKKLGWVFLGSFMITRANILIITSFFGLTQAASYGLTFQVLTVIVSLSSVIISLQMPKINAFQMSGNHTEVLKSFSSSLVVAWFTFLPGSMMLVFVLPDILSLISSSTHLLEMNILALFSLVMFLELNHGMCASYLTSYNEVPFVKAALWSGAGVVLGSLFMVVILDVGMVGVILAQGVVQLLYNNWKWPMEAGKRLGLPFFHVILFGLKRVKGGFLWGK